MPYKIEPKEYVQLSLKSILYDVIDFMESYPIPHMSGAKYAQRIKHIGTDIFGLMNELFNSEYLHTDYSDHQFYAAITHIQGKIEQARDLRVGAAGGDQVQDLSLTLGQGLDQGAARRQIEMCLGGQEAVHKPGERRANGWQERGDGLSFVQESSPIVLGRGDAHGSLDRVSRLVTATQLAPQDCLL